MLARIILLALLALPGIGSSGSPWDERAEEWTQRDATQILRDSPWCPAGDKIRVTWNQFHIAPPTARETVSPVRPLPSVSVLWWSSKTVRLAEQRLRQLRNPAGRAEPLKADDLPDYVLSIEGSETLRILRDAQESLRDTTYLELPGGARLDLDNVRFFDSLDGQSVEFHFRRRIGGRATIETDAERLIFHCEASAKTPRSGRPNALSVRAEFEPRAMRAHDQPDL